MRKLCILLVSLVVGLSATGCNQNNDKIESLESQIATLEELNKGLSAEIEGLNETIKTLSAEIAEPNPTDESDNTEDGQEDSDSDETETSILKGQLVAVDDYCEFTVVNCEFAKKVLPTNPSGYYTYYEVKDNNKSYLHLAVEVKNLLTISKDGEDFLGITALYDNKYEYTGFKVTEKDGGVGFEVYGGISPLTAKRVHSLIEIPDDIIDTNKPIVLKISANGESFQFDARAE